MLCKQANIVFGQPSFYCSWLAKLKDGWSVFYTGYIFHVYFSLIYTRRRTRNLHIYAFQSRDNGRPVDQLNSPQQ